MTTSAEIIAQCGIAGTAASASKTKWGLEATFMQAAAAAAGAGETGDALRLGYDVSATTRDAMDSAAALYTKISSWDLVTTPKNAISFKTYDTNIQIPSTLNIDLLGDSSLFYKNTSGFPSVINLRGNETTTLYSVLNSSGTAGQGVGKGMSASLMMYSSQLSSLSITVDGQSNNVTRLWEQAAASTGSSSLIRLDLGVMILSETTSVQYVVFIKPTRYGATFSV